MIRKIILKLAHITHLDYFNINIQKGIGKGIKWTLLPYSMYWRGQTEKPMDQIIKNLNIKNEPTIWDLGAHFGYYSLIFSKLFPNGKIFAFEPDPESFKRLKYHIKINQKKNIKAFNLALGEKDASSFLDQSAGIGEPTNKINHKTGKKIEMIKLDSFIKKWETKIPDLIKIDIEGYGGEAILGGIEMIKINKPKIIFSFHNNQELQKVTNILKPLDYKAFSPTKKLIQWKNIKGTVLLSVEKIVYNKNAN